MEPNPRTASAQQQQWHDEVTAQMISITREIQSLYDAGAPLFTKDALRKLGDELVLLQRGEQNSRGYTVKGINGVDYAIASPNRTPFYGRQPVRWMWAINYNSIQCLTIYRGIEFFSPGTAYLPMQLSVISWMTDPTREGNLISSSTEDLRRAFQDSERQLRTGGYEERLREKLSTLETPFVLDKIVAFALGPLARESREVDRPTAQHALVSVLHSSLVQRGILSATSRRYLQDPIYEKMDMDALSSEGFTVLDDPQGFLVLDESSVLVSISPNVPVKQIVADICRPGIIIWYRESDLYPCTDPNSPRVANMIQNEYYQVDFPFLELAGDLVMYVRKSA
ncbi:hypothetical protein GGR54DRAFT_615385 [Hypoxylon sp. NC1633]|nr:hypothetical protein GGR54DRAFT_615385 [Hypoxylon sp. NC1633]